MVGLSVGLSEGFSVGFLVGLYVGLYDGESVGFDVGIINRLDATVDDVMVSSDNSVLFNVSALSGVEVVSSHNSVEIIASVVDITVDLGFSQNVTATLLLVVPSWVVLPGSTVVADVAMVVVVVVTS